MARRVYFPYQLREECRDSGMWRVVAGTDARRGYIDASAALMRDCDAFLSAMCRAVDEWPNSCLTVMTADTMNHRAWFGHAGCFLATGSPEDCTRLGWHTLDLDEQYAANATADLAIEVWRGRHRHRIARDTLFPEVA
jgi:hypothetical protein